MASNLNKAFMRAYAKDSGRSVSEPVAAAPGNARPTNPTANWTQPAEPAPQAASRSPLHRQAFANLQASVSQASTSQMPTSQMPTSQMPTSQMPTSQEHRPQFASQTPIPASHLPGQPPAPPQNVSGRNVQNNAPAPAADPMGAADAANVWQRLDAAQALQTPHMVNPQSRPISSAVGVGAASGPKHMHAATNAPLAPMGRTGDLRQPPTHMPLLPDAPNALTADPQALETRRRTVADFLYSAGKVSASAAAAAPARPAADNASRSHMERPLGRPAGAPPNLAAARTPVSATARQSGSSMFEAERTYGPTASAVRSPAHAPVHASVHAPVHAPVTRPEPEVAPGPVQPSIIQPASIQPSSIQPSSIQPSSRAGHIVRVDMPKPPLTGDADAARTAAYAHGATDQAMLDAQDRAVAEQVAGRQQRRTDHVHDLSAAEQKLRRAKHKIFNPVWEVDSLQWPGVCDKLMEHRAESMAQVAAHLKAACQDGLSILGVTSPASGEGRTTVACCLARLAATHGLNVVLVDLDLEHPTLCLQTNLEVEHDWRDCLNGNIDLEEVAVHSIDDQLTLLPLKDGSEHPELLAGDMRIADILRELSESFELVIVDACRMHSAGNVISGLAAAQVFDAAIVVVDRRNTQHERIEDAVQLLQQTGVGSIGIVDNFSM